MIGDGQRAAYNASLIINGEQYVLDDGAEESPWRRETVETQPADGTEEFERVILNQGLGWGENRYTRAGGYDYGYPAVLHKRGLWLPGAAVTDRTPGTTPVGRVSFCEFWDGTAANRRLVVISARYVYEIQPGGTVSTADLGAGFTATNGMTKGVLYKNDAMASAKVYIARRGANSTDYMVERTGAGTYGVSANNKYAAAIAKGKDSVGDDVLWRVQFNGKLNQAVGGSDPSSSGAWESETSSTDVGDNSGRVNDLIQNNRAMVVGRVDGAFTFDNVEQTVPITVGMNQTPDDDNFAWMKEFNGAVLAPTIQGIVWIDGLEWGTCGPSSANRHSRSLGGREVACSGAAGGYWYSAVYDGDDSYIYMHSPRAIEGETGEGPFVAHGPVAVVVGKQVTDLFPSATVVSKRLWIGWVGGLGSIELNDDWTPATDEEEGYIYLPEGTFDLQGPGIVKDFRKAEFVARPSNPFSSTNQWSLEVETTPGSGTYVAIDGGNVTSGVVTDRYWTTETSGKRLRARLRYAGNDGDAELEAVIVRGTARPEVTDQYTFRIKAEDNPRMPAGNRVPETGEAIADRLRALVASGRQTAITFGQDSFMGQVKDVLEVAGRPSAHRPPERMLNVVVRKVKLS